MDNKLEENYPNNSGKSFIKHPIPQNYLTITKLKIKKQRTLIHKQ